MGSVRANSPKFADMPLSSTNDLHLAHEHGDRVHDIRLVVPALCLWATALVGAEGGIRVLEGVVAAAVVGAVIVWRIRWRRSESPLVSLILAALLAVVLGGAAVLPHLYLTERGMHTLYPASTTTPSLSVSTVTHASLATHTRSATVFSPPSQGSRTAASSRVVLGRITSRPLHNATGTRFTLRTAHGEMVIHARSAQCQKLVLGQRVTLVVKPLRPPDHHLSLGEWRAVYLRSARAPQGIWAFSALVAQQWEEALTLADTAGLTTSLHALARGMTIGDTSGLTSDQQRCYRASGLTHLTAVSGANVSYVLLLAGVTLHHASPRRRVIVHSILLILFAALIGPEPAVLRATISGAVGVIALWEGGRSAAFPALGAGILSLIIISPLFAVSPGFLLSVAATAALIWAAPRVVEKFVQFGLPPVASEVLAVTVVAAISTLPLSLYLFGTASVLGALANIMVAPAVPLITAVGLVGVMTSFVFPPMGAVLLMVLVPALWWVEKVGMALGGLSWAQLSLPQELSPGLVPPLVPSLLATAVLAAAVLTCYTRRGRGVVTVLVIVAGVVTGGHALASYRHLMACQRQPDALTLVSSAPNVTSSRDSVFSSTHTVRVEHRGSNHRPRRPVILLEGAITAVTLPRIDELASSLRDPVFVHLNTVTTHVAVTCGSSPSTYHPGSLSASVSARESLRGSSTVSSRVSLTPGGTPVVELAPGETVTITKTNQICALAMAR